MTRSSAASAVVPGPARLVAALVVAVLVVGALCAVVGMTAPRAAASVPGPAIVALPAAAKPVPGSLRPIAPARILDTRSAATRPAAGSVLRVQIAGAGGVPQSGVAAALLHVTATAVRLPGYVTAYAAGATPPSTSTLNFALGRTVSNNVLVSLGRGAVSLHLVGAADLVVDVLGWVVAGSPVSAGGVVPVAQARLLDTRSVRSPLTQTTRNLRVAGVGGVPADAASVVLNLTAVDAARSAPVTVWPSGLARPGTSNLNTQAGRAIAEQVVVALGSGGEVSFALAGAGSTDLVVDLIGYVAGGVAGPSGTVSTQPARVLDTRTSGGAMRSGATRTIALAGAVPDDAAAAVLTITSVPGVSAGGYLVAYADGAPRPAISDLNPMTDVPVAIQVVVPLGPDRGVSVSYVSGSGDIAVDLDGYVHAPLLPEVAPAVLAQADLSPLDGTAASTARSVLLTADRYALQTWWPTTGRTLLQQPFDQTAQSNHQDPIRRVSMEAFSLAVAVATGGYDATAVGATQDVAVAVVSTIVATVACAHRANQVGGWGGSWQSMMWASYAGRAAWLLWDDLSAATQRCVQRMVLSEADFVSTITPRYMVSSSGVVLTPGNSGAEEDSWYALAPALAVAMMPAAEQRDVWRRQEQQLLVSAWSRPGDVSSSQLVDGVPLSTWLKGSNLAANGVVVNHSRIAPDYSTNGYQSIDTMVMATLARQAAPQATTFGLSAVYASLSSVGYPAPPYAAPGGAVYPSGSATVYYPQGCDWGTGQELPYALFDTEADLFGFGAAGLPTAAAVAAQEHLDAAAQMQARTPSGAMYVSTAEYNYVGREEHTAQLAGQLYLADFVDLRLQRAVTAQPVVPSSTVAVLSESIPPAPVDERTLQR